jgi:hypothetical protein
VAAVLTWYLARGAGMAAFGALSVATAAGAYSSRRHGEPGRRVVWQYVHRSAALSGLVLLIAHVGLLLADSYAGVGWRGAVLPFASGYRPGAVTVGLVAMYLIVAVGVSGLLRSRFARSVRAARWWRGIHLAAYAGWSMSAWHFLVVGTDAGTGWARALLLGGVVLVALGVIARLVDGPAPGPRGLAPAPATTRIAAAARTAPAARRTVSTGAHR